MEKEQCNKWTWNLRQTAFYHSWGLRLRPACLTPPKLSWIVTTTMLPFFVWIKCVACSKNRLFFGPSSWVPYTSRRYVPSLERINTYRTPLSSSILYSRSPTTGSLSILQLWLSDYYYQNLNSQTKHNSCFSI
jgi:hypothetical protein